MTAALTTPTPTTHTTELCDQASCLDATSHHTLCTCSCNGAGHGHGRANQRLTPSPAPLSDTAFAARLRDVFAATNNDDDWGF